jgi:hypothetical protein
MDLIELYSKIVESTGWEINSNGRINDFGGPVEIAGKGLIIPTNDTLRNPDWDHTMAFHPMSENVMRGESAVLFALRNQMQYKLNFIANVIIQELGELAADVTRQKTLTIKQKEYLKLVPDFDSKTVKAIDSVLDKANPSEPEKIIGLFVKRSGTIDDKQYKRIATVHSPLRLEDNNKDRTIFGVKFRVCDYLPFFDLFDVILPDVNSNRYSVGSNSMVAPSFHALLGAYITAAKRLNVVLRKFQKVWGDDFEELLIDISWEEDVVNLDQYKGIIPNLRGNEGSVNPDEVEQVAEGEPKSEVNKLTNKQKWEAKQSQSSAEVKKMTLTEKLALNAPKQKPTAFNSTPAAAAPVAKKSFAEMMGNNNPPTQSHQPTPYAAHVSNGFNQQSNGFGNQQQGGGFGQQQSSPGWGGQQQGNAQPQNNGRQSTPYGQSPRQQGGWGGNNNNGNW